MNFQMFKLDFEKAEEPEITFANICWIIKEAREFQKNIYFCFIDYAKAFDSLTAPQFCHQSNGEDVNSACLMGLLW